MKRILCVWMIFLLLCPFCVGAAQDIEYYSLGEVAADFSLTTPDGETITLRGLLQEHRAVLLNFWFADCGPSRYEFPFLQNAYEQYNGDVEVLAVTPYDDDETIRQYQEAMGLTFLMAYDSAGITDRFVDYGFPTNVLIDRNGVVCYIECGAHASADTFVRLLIPFVQDDYSGPLLLSSIPSVMPPEPPDYSALDAALNVEGGSLAFYCPQDSWPWVVSDDGEYAISSNIGVNNTVCQLETQINAEAGDVLAFRYCTSTEEGSDLLTVMINYEIVKVFSGENDWSSYALPIEQDGAAIITFEYIKNDMDAAGNDAACLNDVAVLSGDDAAQALEGNPSYPRSLEGMQVSLQFLSEKAREIVFDDPIGMVNAYFHADEYYIIPEQRQTVCIKLGADCDPDAAFVRNMLGVTRTLSHCAYRKAYYYSFLKPESLYGWNALMLVPSITDAYGQYSRIFIYFDSEEAVNVFCSEQIPALLGSEPATEITWHYAQ